MGRMEGSDGMGKPKGTRDRRSIQGWSEDVMVKIIIMVGSYLYRKVSYYVLSTKNTIYDLIIYIFIHEKRLQ